MIVVAIIGILSSVAVPAYQEYIASSSGGAAMKGIGAHVSQAQTCVIAGTGCVQLKSSAGNESMIILAPLDPVLGVQQVLTWDTGTCVLVAAVSGVGSVAYTARVSATAGASTTNHSVLKVLA